jgi:hypothetical protein
VTHSDLAGQWVPSVHVEVLSGPTDYAKVFGSIPGHQAPVNPGELDSFKALVEYGVSNDRIRAHFLPQRAFDERNEMLEGLLAIQVRGLAIAIIDRSIHLFGEQDITFEQILPSYLELEAGVLADQLAIEILVPLALTHVGADDRIQLDDFAYIERMSEETHLARYPRDSFWLPAHGICRVRGYPCPSSIAVSNECGERLGSSPVSAHLLPRRSR